MIKYGIHWLSFTGFGNIEEAFTIYKILFEDKFGNLEELGNGGRGFKRILFSLMGFKLYIEPNNLENYYHFEIPGKACELIEIEYFRALEEILKNNVNKYRYKRIDLAFDNVGFNPMEIENEIIENNFRSLVKRETLRIFKSPYELRDDGNKGTNTVQLGSNQSDRMITIYDKRGYTRLEFQARNERANLIARDLFNSSNNDNFYKIMISHLRDYIDFEFEPWKIFVNNIGRANLCIGEPKKIELENLINWFDKQIAPAFSAIVDTVKPEKINNMIENARYRRKTKYNNLIEVNNVVKS